MSNTPIFVDWPCDPRPARCGRCWLDRGSVIPVQYTTRFRTFLSTSTWEFVTPHVVVTRATSFTLWRSRVPGLGSHAEYSMKNAAASLTSTRSLRNMGCFLHTTVSGGWYFEYCIAVLLHFAWMRRGIKFYCRTVRIKLMTVTYRLHSGSSSSLQRAISKRALSHTEDVTYGLVHGKSIVIFIVCPMHRILADEFSSHPFDSCLFIEVVCCSR